MELVKAVTAVPDNLNIQDHDHGNTPLMVVIKEGSSTNPEFVLEATKFLVQDCACNQHLTNSKGFQALHLACQHDSLLDVVKLLDLTFALRASRSKFETKPVEIAIASGNIKILEYMLSNAPFEDELTMFELINFSLNARQPRPEAARLILKGLTLKRILVHQQDMSSQTASFLLHGLTTVNISEISLSDNGLLASTICMS